MSDSFLHICHSSGRLCERQRKDKHCEALMIATAKAGSSCVLLMLCTVLSPCSLLCEKPTSPISPRERKRKRENKLIMMMMMMMMMMVMMMPARRFHNFMEICWLWNPLRQRRPKQKGQGQRMAAKRKAASLSMEQNSIVRFTVIACTSSRRHTMEGEK